MILGENVELRFDDALVGFKQFLARNKFPDEIVWIAPNDVLSSGSTRIYVKAKPDQSNESRVRELFNAAVAHNTGILLAALCEMNEKTLCYAWVPADALEADRNLIPKGVKMSAPTDRHICAIPVRSGLKWLYLNVRYRRAQESRNELFT
jgi:hypothetical protein